MEYLIVIKINKIINYTKKTYNYKDTITVII